MASQNKINLIKIKNHLQNKNFKIGGFLNFKSDASEKIFKLCNVANDITKSKCLDLKGNFFSIITRY